MKMSLRLTNVARITACTIKLVSYARGESLPERVFHVEEIPYIENKFDVREFKSESMGAPARCATCYLSDFNETWPV